MTIGHIKASELLRIGDSIRILRKNKGWTQKKLAIESGIHEVQIRRYENNHSLPRDEQLQKLANALGVENDFFTKSWRKKQEYPFLPCRNMNQATGIQK